MLVKLPKKKFLDTTASFLCPHEVELVDYEDCETTVGAYTCVECWMNAVEMEVKEDV